LDSDYVQLVSSANITFQDYSEWLLGEATPRILHSSAMLIVVRVCPALNSLTVMACFGVIDAAVRAILTHLAAAGIPISLPGDRPSTVKLLLDAIQEEVTTSLDFVQSFIADVVSKRSTSLPFFFWQAFHKSPTI
jgi:hypothetical protein